MAPFDFLVCTVTVNLSCVIFVLHKHKIQQIKQNKRTFRNVENSTIRWITYDFLLVFPVKAQLNLVPFLSLRWIISWIWNQRHWKLHHLIDCLRVSARANPPTGNKRRQIISLTGQLEHRLRSCAELLCAEQLILVMRGVAMETFLTGFRRFAANDCVVKGGGSSGGSHGRATPRCYNDP